MSSRLSRRMTIISALIATALSCFTLGMMHSRRLDRSGYDRRLDALREELQTALLRDGNMAAGTSGTLGAQVDGPTDGVATERSALVAEIKEQLRTEMGLLPVRLIRERRSSFVELYMYDNLGQKNYGTAGYLGDGYFVTVKHAVAALSDKEGRSERKVTAVKIVYEGKEVPARVVDMGDATMEVDPGDWAIIRTRPLDLPALNLDTAFAYEFATPIFRLGNDYSKGVVVSTGYIGQRTTGGLVTASPMGIRVCRAEACSISGACSSASPSAGCRATTASRSSCRFAARCCGRCRASS